MADNDAYRKEVLEQTRIRQKEDMDEFFDAFRKDRRTVILLPGGMGSQLYRADRPFEEGTNGPYRFDEIWLDRGIFGPARDGLKLVIDQDGFDLNRHIVVADEDTTFVGVSPYVKALKFFRDQGFNTVFLAWDWRRKLTTAVDALHCLINQIKRKGESLGDPQGVMEKVFLVGHSMGGMVAKLFFEKHRALAAEIGGMISVGTPFYGYFGQLRHAFEGETKLNCRYGAQTVAKISASAPGLYTLLPIDEDTWRHQRQDIGLPDYPLKDQDGQIADAYQKGAPPFPQWIKLGELPGALKLRHLLAAELPEGLKAKVHHIRGSKANRTAVSAIWDQTLPPDYDPDQRPSPLKFGFGTGDDTIPYWSAALCKMPSGHVIDFDQGVHMKLLEQTFVLRELLKIVAGRSISEQEFVDKYGPEAPIATREELNAFLQDVNLAEDTIPEPFAWRILQELSN